MSIKQIFQETKKNLSSESLNQTTMDIFQDYHKRIQQFLTLTNLNGQEDIKIQETQQANTVQDNSVSTQDNNSPAQTPEPSYMFLRNIWQGKYASKKSHDQNSQDHIDKINKVVAMMRTRIGYMTKKENYLYEKQQANHQYLYGNPHFIKIKQELQRLRMANQEILTKNLQQEQQIKQLRNDKNLLEISFQELKKKHQNMQKNWIQVSKKNIYLEQEYIGMKSQPSRNRLSELRESADIKQVNLVQSLNLKSTLSFKKMADGQKDQNKITTLYPQRKNKENSQNSSNFKPLQNIFVDISIKQIKQSKNDSDCYPKCNLQNQEVQCLKDVSNQIQSPVQDMSFGLTDRFRQEKSPLKFKYIKYQPCGRKALLSSVRSVDLAEKTSIAKPKFERTKINYQNLLKSVGKQGAVSPEQYLQQPSTLKKRNILLGQSALLNIFKSPTRERIRNNQ